jgi:23S rRNA pseudouridine2605 synthase
MCDAIGHPVVRLVRTAIGPVHDRRLRPGDWRPLRVAELHALYRAVAPSRAAGGVPNPSGRRAGPG